MHRSPLHRPSTLRVRAILQPATDNRTTTSKPCSIRGRNQGSQRGTTNVEGRSTIPSYDHTDVAKIFHPLLALIASAADRQLARYIEYLKVENKILRARIPGEIH